MHSTSKHIIILLFNYWCTFERWGNKGKRIALGSTLFFISSYNALLLIKYIHIICNENYWKHLSFAYRANNKEQSNLLIITDLYNSTTTWHLSNDDIYNTHIGYLNYPVATQCCLFTIFIDINCDCLYKLFLFSA